MAGNAGNNTLGSYTVLRKLKGALQAPCAHPGRELAELADLATSALESVEGLPEVQRHLESRSSLWRRLWRTQARVRPAYLGALAGAVAAGLVALLASATVRPTMRLAKPGAAALAGVAEQAFVAPEALPVAYLDDQAPALALDMPRKPFTDQYRVDKEGKCKGKNETPLFGGCWVALEPKAPCEESYEHNGKCYLPSMPSARAPSSTAPRIPLGPAQRAP